MFASHGPQKRARGRFWYLNHPALGKVATGFLCGQIVGVETHYLSTTKPCRADLTKGRMKCFCSAMKLESVWKGYVPLLDQDGVQCFAIIGERYADLAFKIPMWAPVTVSRLRHKGQPICVKYEQWTDIEPKTHFGVKTIKDLRPWLLKLWGDAELVKWLEEHPDVLDQAGEPGPLEKSVSPMMKGPARRVEQSVPRPVETIGDVLTGRPELNGKGHK